MSTKMIECELYIGRDNRNIFNIEVKDESSGARFLRISMSAEQFALAITGLCTSGITAEVSGLDRVGKLKVRQPRRREFTGDPKITYDTDGLSNWLKENHQEEGWILDTYLGSKNSRQNVGDKTFLNYAVYKYVDVE